MTSSWYTKEESPLRMGIWHAGNIISNVISGFLAAGILEHMNNVAGLRSWQWFLLLEGMVSIVVACIGFWGLPNWPHNTGEYFFTKEESQMSQYRMKVSAGGQTEDDEGGYWEGFSMAMKGKSLVAKRFSMSLTFNRSIHLFVRWHALFACAVPSLQGLLSICTFIDGLFLLSLNVLGCRHTRLQFHSNVSRPSSSVHYRVLRHPGSLLVVWALSRIMLAYHRGHTYMYVRGDPHDLDPQHRRPLFRIDIASFWSICRS